MQLQETIGLIQGELWDRLSRLSIVERFAPLLPTKGKANTLIGMRRVGKTFCLLSYLQSLGRQQVPRESILFLNLEDDRLPIREVADLTEAIDNFYRTTPENHRRQTFILLDEIQAVPNWERVTRRLIETDRCELWLTGSSARLLSKDVATQFRGRSITREVWPYDFFEFLAATHLEWIDPSVSFASRDLSRQQLEHYLLSGGFPELVLEPAETRQRILEDYRSVVVLRDVVERHRVSNTSALEELVSTVIINSGTLLSVNKLAADLKSRGIHVGKDTLYEYLDYLDDAYLAFLVPLYHRSLRIRGTTPKKVYAVDTGLVSAYSLRPKADLGRLFENLVFIDLKRRGYKVFYYMTASGAEVDFVAVGNAGQPFIVQACFDVSADETRLREERALKEATAELGCGGMVITPQLYAQGREWIPKI